MFIGAKHYAALLALSALGASGCAALDLQRFAPPGIVKYEDLAKDTPPNPAIVERVKEVKAQSDGRYPKLSQQPQRSPKALPVARIEDRENVLREAGAALNNAVAVERAISIDERASGVVMPGDAEKAERTLEEAAAALAEEVARADEEARRERDMPPRPATPDNQ